MRTDPPIVHQGTAGHGRIDADDSFKVLWAKSQPRHALWKHLLDAAAVSLALPSAAGDLGLDDNEVAFLVGLHDIGKASPQFQHRVPDLSAAVAAAGFPRTADADCRHERLSAEFVRDLFKGHLGRRETDAVALAVAAHHGHWEDRATPLGKRYLFAQQQLCNLLREVLQIGQLPTPSWVDLSAFGMLLAGRVVLADWLASNERFLSDERLVGLEEPSRYFHAAREVARGWVTRLGFCSRRRASHADGVVQSPRPLQQALLEQAIPPSLVIIEAPMGEGKTEAAWILAEKWREHGLRGLYMALPTMATSDSLFERYRRDYLAKLDADAQLRLVHGMAWLRDETEDQMQLVTGDTAEEAQDAVAWFRPTRRAMLADHGVGTVDQAMLAGMNVKFGFLRLYGLKKRALVIDEIHAYDAYMSAIIERLLTWCATLGVPVVLLSATLASSQRRAMVLAYGGELPEAADEDPERARYPLITVVEKGKRPRFIPVASALARDLIVECVPGALGDGERTAALALQAVKHGGCCCVVVNTVRQAQVVYQALDLPESDKLLFHARFKAADRTRLANEVVRLFGKDRGARPARCVLVATQVVEQSLDVDFDHMISEIAPIDLLLQRSGRLHRHVARAHGPRLLVLTPEPGCLDFAGTGYIYARKPLLRTLAILGDTEAPMRFSLPSDFRMLIERCYGTSTWEQSAVPWAEIFAADKEWEEQTGLLRSQARQFLLKEPRSDRFLPVENNPVGDDSDDGNGWRAQTRLGAAEQTALLVPVSDLDRLAAGELSMEEVRDLYRSSVRVPGYLPADSPAEGFSAAVRGRGRLKGVLLLPVTEEGLWRGVSEKGGVVEVSYDDVLGLQVRRVT